MKLPASKFKKSLLATAIGIAALGGAPVVQATIIEANVDYILDGTLPVLLPDPSATNDNETSSTTPSSVDVLDTLDDGEGGNSIFYHTYGNTAGNFGSRVSGSGTFDITGSFSFFNTYTNSTGVAQDYALEFTIIAGQLGTSGFLESLETLYASFGIDIEVDFNQDGIWDANIFHSSASLTTDATTTTFAQAGTSLTASSPGSLLGADGANYRWSEGDFTAGIGSISAGDSFDLRYVLTTTATGNMTDPSSCTGRFLDPGFDGIGDEEPGMVEGFEGDGAGEFAEGYCGNAISRIGDPLHFGSGPLQSHPIDPSNMASISFDPSNTNQVPEPGSLALLGLGLSAIFWGRRKTK